MSVRTLIITASVAHRARTLVLSTAVASRVRTTLLRTGPAGASGASAYQSYLATSADDPLLSEAEWAAGGGGGAHKSTHAIGGADALTPTDIGAPSLPVKRTSSFNAVVGGYYMLNATAANITPPAGAQIGDTFTILCFSGSGNSVVGVAGGATGNINPSPIPYVFIYDTGSGWALATSQQTAVGRAVLAAATASAARTELGAGATGDELFRAGTVAAVLASLQLWQEVPLGSPTVYAGTVNNGDGSFTATSVPIGPMVEYTATPALAGGAVYMLILECTAISSGTFQLYLSLGGARTFPVILTPQTAVGFIGAIGIFGGSIPARIAIRAGIITTASFRGIKLYRLF